MSRRIAINCRTLSAPKAGVHRYLSEILRAWDTSGRIASLRLLHSRARGVRGHVWEQMALPITAGDNVLWCPSNSGPVLHPRLAVTIHDLQQVDNPQWYGRRFAMWYDRLLRTLARRAAVIITGSDFSRRRIRDVLGVDEGRIACIPYGVDARFRPLQGERWRDLLMPALRQERFLLTVGSLKPNKNLAFLIGAWRRIRDRIGDRHRLVVVGERERSGAFRDVAFDDVDGVVFTGRIDDDTLCAYYNAAEAFVFPSLYEGFGLPVVESMACGTPVVCSDATSLPEVAGDAALLFDPTSVDELIECVARVIDDTAVRSRLRAAGLERAARFGWARCAEATWQVLHRLAVR